MREYWKSIDPDSQMFDFSGFYQSIAESLPNDCRIVECGVANGKSMIYLAEAILNLGKTFERFIAVDNLDYGGRNQRNDIVKHLIGSGLGNRIEFLDISSLDASCKFPDEYLDFVFLDSSHEYNQSRSEIVLWMKKIKHGGILAGHDYFGHIDVCNAVNEMIPAEHIKTTDTDNGFGVWSVTKHPSIKFLY